MLGTFERAVSFTRMNINLSPSWIHRREFLSRTAMGLAFLTAPGVFAEELLRTPKQTEGPFYPDHLPLDTDNDLLVINDGITPAVGEVTYLSGRILGPDGAPIRGALVEIWQCDASGVYIHSRSGGATEKKDKNFQGFGRFLTGASGEYLFRTIKPVPYTGRTPHIHLAVKMKGRERWTTQCYIKGHAGNEKDGIWKSVKDDAARASITPEFAPMPGAKAGELAAKFDVVMGFTPTA